MGQLLLSLVDYLATPSVLLLVIGTCYGAIVVIQLLMISRLRDVPSARTPTHEDNRGSKWAATTHEYSWHLVFGFICIVLLFLYTFKNLILLQLGDRAWIHAYVNLLVQQNSLAVLLVVGFLTAICKLAIDQLFYRISEEIREKNRFWRRFGWALWFAVSFSAAVLLSLCAKREREETLTGRLDDVAVQLIKAAEETTLTPTSTPTDVPTTSPGKTEEGLASPDGAEPEASGTADPTNAEPAAAGAEGAAPAEPAPTAPTEKATEKAAEEPDDEETIEPGNEATASADGGEVVPDPQAIQILKELRRVMKEQFDQLQQEPVRLTKGINDVKSQLKIIYDDASGAVNHGDSREGVITALKNARLERVEEFSRKIADLNAERKKNNLPPLEFEGPPSKLAAILIALSASLVLMGTHVALLILFISRKLQETHGFRGPSVRRFFQRFFFFPVPYQMVVIGPKGGGKSRLTATYIPNELALTIDEKYGTMFPRFWNRPDEKRLISIADMPGENLGDQLAYMRDYRIDKLVLVVHASGLVDKKADTQDKFTLEGVRDLFNDSKIGKYSQDYFIALRHALMHTLPPKDPPSDDDADVDGADHAPPSEDDKALKQETAESKEDYRGPFRFGVRQLWLVLNCAETEEKVLEKRKRFSQGLQRLSVHVGKLVELAPKRCHAVVLNAQTAGVYEKLGEWN